MYLVFEDKIHCPTKTEKGPGGCMTGWRLHVRILWPQESTLLLVLCIFPFFQNLSAGMCAPGGERVLAGMEQAEQPGHPPYGGGDDGGGAPPT